MAFERTGYLSRVSIENTTVLAAAVTDKIPRLLFLHLVAGPAGVTVQFWSNGTGGTALTPGISYAANQVVTIPYVECGILESTTAGHTLNAVVAAGAMKGWAVVQYMN
jgi:hypothetical protein